MSNAGKSPRAYARYRELVAEANSRPIRLCQDTDLTDAEIWWCELTPLESWVFGIDPAILNALVIAYVRYQDMIDCTDIEFSAFRDEERAAFPACFHGERIDSMDGAIGFMVDACELPFEQAMMWVCRTQVQNVRSGLYNGPRGAPDWARGDVETKGLYKDPHSWKLEDARGYR